MCDQINVGLYEGGNDIISNGVLNDLYDKKAHLDDPYNLHYVSDNTKTSYFWITSPHTVDKPVSLQTTPVLKNTLNL